jgi:hypothetical protein
MNAMSKKEAERLRRGSLASDDALRKAGHFVVGC